MKNKILLALITLPILCSAQIEMGVQFGMNYPIDYSSNATARKLGSEIQLQIDKAFENDFGIESGFLVEAYGRNTSNTVVTREDASFMRIQIYFPVLAYYSLYENRIILKSGILLGVRNFLTFSNYSGLDPELEYNENIDSASKHFGLDFSIGIDYRINKRLGTSINYRTPFDNSKQGYGVLSCGINYKIVSR